MRVDETLEKIVQAVQPYEFSTFVIGFERPRPYDREAHEAMCRELKIELGEGLVRRLAHVRVDFQRPDLRLRIDLDGQVRVEPAPLFIGGRYRKLSRGIPSSRWIHHHCAGRGCPSCSHTGTLCGPSIEELLSAPVLRHSGGSRSLFHALGREDTDARMLGKGRPFVLEVERPLERTLPLAAIREEFLESAAGSAEVSPLSPVPPAARSLVKSIQADKTYRAWIEAGHVLPGSTAERVSRLAGVSIDQMSPARVRHRRGAGTHRLRRILESTWMGEIDGCHVWELTVESGTYVKELVSGDAGRTRPSLSGILEVPCRCAALDVLAVHWEPPWESGACPGSSG